MLSLERAHSAPIENRRVGLSTKTGSLGLHAALAFLPNVMVTLPFPISMVPSGWVRAEVIPCSPAWCSFSCVPRYSARERSRRWRSAGSPNQLQRHVGPRWYWGFSGGERRPDGGGCGVKRDGEVGPGGAAGVGEGLGVRLVGQCWGGDPVAGAQIKGRCCAFIPRVLSCSPPFLWPQVVRRSP